jgi:hypothetical protein
MERKLTKAPKWTPEIRAQLRATDSRVYLPEPSPEWLRKLEIARGNAEGAHDSLRTGL